MNATSANGDEGKGKAFIVEPHSTILTLFIDLEQMFCLFLLINNSVSEMCYCKYSVYVRSKLVQVKRSVRCK